LTSFPVLMRAVLFAGCLRKAGAAVTTAVPFAACLTVRVDVALPIAVVPVDCRRLLLTPHVPLYTCGRYFTLVTC